MKAAKYLLIVLVALGLRICMIFVYGGDPIVDASPYRKIVIAWHVFPFALGILALTYGALAAVFRSFRPQWRASPAVAGLYSALPFGLLWIVGMIEASLVSGTSFRKELLFGLCEVPSILAVGALTGLFFGAEKSTVPVTAPRSPSADLKTAAAIVISLLAGRYLSYSVIAVESAYLTFPAETFAWTLSFGITVGILYCCFAGSLGGSPVRRGIIFGFVIFGIDWTLFTQVVPVLFYVTPFEWFRSFFVRALVDCAFVALGIAVSARAQQSE